MLVLLAVFSIASAVCQDDRTIPGQETATMTLYANPQGGEPGDHCPSPCDIPSSSVTVNVAASCAAWPHPSGGAVSYSKFDCHRSHRALVFQEYANCNCTGDASETEVEEGHCVVDNDPMFCMKLIDYSGCEDWSEDRVALFRFVFGGVILVTTLVFAVIPLLVTKTSNLSDGAMTTGMSWASCFAGGLFVGVGIVHLLYEATEEFIDSGNDEPWPNVLFAAGFMFVLILEKTLRGHDGTQQSLLHENESEKKEESFIRSVIVLTSILAFHALLEGVLLGLKQTVEGQTVLFIAIMGHKWAEAFALGVALLKADVFFPAALLTIVFYSATTPLGIMLGWMLSGSSTDSVELLTGVLFAIGAGVFVYVALMEILLKEFQQDLSRGESITRVLFAVAGFALMSLLVILFHDHGHDDHGHAHGHSR